jgi:hypothetical protein
MDSSHQAAGHSQAWFATVNQAPIDLPEQVLIMIVSRVRDVRREIALRRRDARDRVRVPPLAKAGEGRADRRRASLAESTGCSRGGGVPVLLPARYVAPYRG